MPRAHEFVGGRRLQEANRRPDAGIGWHNNARNAEFLGKASRMDRCGATERDQGAASDVGAAFDGMHAGGVGHVLVDDLGDTVGRHHRVEA